MKTVAMNQMMERARMTPLKIAILFMVGAAIGLAMVSMGWAQTTSQKHTQKKHKTVAHQTHKSSKKSVAKKSSKKSIAKKSSKSKSIAAKKKPAPATALKTFSHPDGHFHVKYPKSWEINSREDAMIAKSVGESGDRAVFGIVRRPDDQPNQDAITKEFEDPQRPSDLVQMPAKVAGMNATKVMGTSKADPSNLMVEYYVMNPNGHQYYVLMMAPRYNWDRYKVAFNTMLGNLSLN